MKVQVRRQARIRWRRLRLLPRQVLRGESRPLRPQRRLRQEGILELCRFDPELYRVAIPAVVHLGWVDLNLGSFHGWWAATVATDLPKQGEGTSQI